MGSSVEVTLSGSDLDDASQLIFSTPGFSASLVKGTVFRVSIPKEIAAGPVDLRVAGKWGVSNPRVFMVDTFAETIEQEPNDLREDAKQVGINQVVNGRIDRRGDVDYYVFKAKKGNQLTVECQCAEIDSPLDPMLTLFDPDGHPIATGRSTGGLTTRDPRLSFVASRDGDFRLRLHDMTYEGSGEYVYRFVVHDYPVADAIFPPVATAGQKSTVLVHGFGYRDATNSTASAPAHLGNLPDSVTWTAPTWQEFETGVDRAHLLLRYPRQMSLPMLAWTWPDRTLAAKDRGRPAAWLTDSPVIVSSGKNHSAKDAQLVTLPVMVAARGGPKDSWFRFAAEKGMTIAFDLTAERAGFRGDYALAVWRLDASATTPVFLAELDDPVTNPATDLFRQHLHDPTGTIVIPETGSYLVQVMERSGIELSHHSLFGLSIGPSNPSVRVVAMPAEDGASATVVRRGSTAGVHLTVIRSGGYDKPVTVTAADLPPGIQAASVTIPGTMTQSLLVLSAAEDAPEETASINFHATVSLPNRPQRQRVFLADKLVTPKAKGNPIIARASRSYAIAVRSGAPFRLDAKLPSQRVAPGSTVPLIVKVNRRDGWTGEVAKIGLASAPPGVTAAPSSVESAKVETELMVQIPKEMASAEYPLFVEGSGEVEVSKNPSDPKAAKVKATFSPPSPPVMLGIGKRAIDATLTPAAIQLKAGGSTPVKISIARQADGGTGPIRVEMVGASDTAVSADPILIAADSNEGTMQVKRSEKGALPPRILLRLTIEGSESPLIVSLACHDG